MSGIRTSLPITSGLMIRRLYSYWKKRRAPDRRSAGGVPPTVSNGAIWITATPRCDSSGTTCTASFSSTAQVSDNVKASPIRIPPVVVFHQQRIGSTSTLVTGGLVAGAWARAAAGAASARKQSRTDLFTAILDRYALVLRSRRSTTNSLNATSDSL